MAMKTLDARQRHDRKGTGSTFRDLSLGKRVGKTESPETIETSFGIHAAPPRVLESEGKPSHSKGAKLADFREPQAGRRENRLAQNDDRPSLPREASDPA